MDSALCSLESKSKMGIEENLLIERSHGCIVVDETGGDGSTGVPDGGAMLVGVVHVLCVRHLHTILGHNSVMGPDVHVLKESVPFFVLGLHFSLREDEFAELAQGRHKADK